MRLISYIYLFTGVAACLVAYMHVKNNPGAIQHIDRSFAWVISLPWSLIPPLIPSAEAMLPIVIFGMGVAVNFALLQWVCART